MTFDRVISIILYIVTVVDVVICIYDFATKGSTSVYMLAATAACICISAVSLYLDHKKKS